MAELVVAHPLARLKTSFDLGEVKSLASVPPTMQPVRRAVIDVGTNSVKLLVAEVNGRVVVPVWEEGNQTRLGEGFYDQHWLQPKPIERTIRAVAAFIEKARVHHAKDIRVIATSAARDAVNRADFVREMQKSTGVCLEVISGDLEAELAFLGVCTDPAHAMSRLLIIDAGGGSTEFILGESGHRRFQQSFPIGAVRLLEQFRPGDLPGSAGLRQCREWLREFVGVQLGPVLSALLPSDKSGARLVGTGGTAAILARMEGGFSDYDRPRIERTHLTAEALSRWVDRLWGLSLEDRRKIVGLPPERADVILTGAAIYESVMQGLGFGELGVSTRGLRFGAVLGRESQSQLQPLPPRCAGEAGAEPSELRGSAMECETDFTRSNVLPPTPGELRD